MLLFGLSHHKLQQALAFMRFLSEAFSEDFSSADANQQLMRSAYRGLRMPRKTLMLIHADPLKELVSLYGKSCNGFGFVVLLLLIRDPKKTLSIASLLLQLPSDENFSV